MKATKLDAAARIAEIIDRRTGLHAQADGDGMIISDDGEGLKYNLIVDSVEEDADLFVLVSVREGLIDGVAAYRSRDAARAACEEETKEPPEWPDHEHQTAVYPLRWRGDIAT